MSETEALTTATAVEAVAWERAPRYPGRTVNRRIVCADGFTVSVQASPMHYANDSHPSGEAAYWRGLDPEVAYPFTTFEVGNPSGDVPSLADWDAGGVWAWVPRKAVAALLDDHGGAVAWGPTRTTTPPAPESATDPSACVEGEAL